MIARAAALALLLAGTLAPWPAPAQLLGDRTEATCSNVNRGTLQNSTVTVICGMPPEQVVELVRLAASPSAGDREALLVHLRAIIPANSRFPVEAVARFLQILREQPVEDAKLADRFAQIAEQHVQLLQEIRQFRVGDPEVQALRDAAAAALQGAPDHDLARAKLEEARQLVRAKREAVARVLADQQREEAALVREQAAGRGRPAALRRGRAAAIERPPACCRRRTATSAGRISSTPGCAGPTRAATSATTPALERAIAAYRAALQERTRERVPLDWAMTQNNLGNALWTLGRAGERHGAAGGGGRRLPRRAGGADPRARAARLGDDPEQPRQRALDARRAGERHGAAGGGGRRLPRRAGGAHPRARAARLGDDPEQPRQRALERSASGRAARRGWRRRSPPTAPRWRNGPASACRSTGR